MGNPIPSTIQGGSQNRGDCPESGASAKVNFILVLADLGGRRMKRPTRLERRFLAMSTPRTTKSVSQGVQRALGLSRKKGEGDVNNNA